jgi:hypothetical protein
MTFAVLGMEQWLIAEGLSWIMCAGEDAIFHIPYFSIDNSHLMYNAHPKLFRRSFWCIDNPHNAN